MTLQIKLQILHFGGRFSHIMDNKYFLPYMNSFMATLMKILIKVCPTLRTGIGFLPCMDSLVFIKVCFMIESFSTVATVIGLLTSVNPLVGNKGRTFRILLSMQDACPMSLFSHLKKMQ